MEYNNERTGMVHLYVGDGKGKSTAALGLAVRALGTGRKALICQFLKGRPTGELRSLERLGATVLRVKECDKFTFQMTTEEFQENQVLHKELLRQSEGAVKAGLADLVVLDEVVDAVNAQVIPLEDLLSLIKQRAPWVELVLTGRNPSEEIAELADYHTVFQCVAHPYQKGIPAREGIEY